MIVVMLVIICDSKVSSFDIVREIHELSITISIGRILGGKDFVQSNSRLMYNDSDICRRPKSTTHLKVEDKYFIPIALLKLLEGL